MFSFLQQAGRLLLAALIFGCGHQGDGLVKHQFGGEVRINGVPRKGVVVALRHTDPTVKGNAAEPVARTDDHGEFSISTNGTGDGAVEGEYIVTFSWISRDGSKDFLSRKYSRPDKSEFRINVGAASDELTLYELTANQADIDAALADQQQPAGN